MKTIKVFNDKLQNIIKSDGLYLFTRNKKILDMTAGGFSFAVLGMNNQKVVNKINQQLKKFCHIDYKTWNDPNIEKLSTVILSKKKHTLDKIYYCGNSGAEACEAAMKLSYTTHLANGYKNKKWFIGRHQSYHGINTDSLSIAERPGLEIYKDFFSKFRALIPQHYYKRYSFKKESEEEYSERSANYLENMILKIGPENVSAFIGETILGGLLGDVVPTVNYWKLIRKVCNKYDVHLILDEVYCGLGASGKIYCCDWDGITPDFIFIGKNLAAGYGALSAVVTKSVFEKKIKEKFGRIPHGSTYQAHSLGIAAALEVQKIIHNKKTLDNINYLGEYMRKILINELSSHPFFYDVRGRGLRFSIEYKCNNQNEFGLKLKEVMLNSFNIFINSKWHRACFTPAYIITKSQCDFFLDKFIQTFKKVSLKF
jgi:adenosylmethionine-8-amino-7-oxononanoate aminotransferase